MSQHCANNGWANNGWANDPSVNDRSANDQRDGDRPGDDRTPSPASSNGASSDADRSSGRLDVSMPQVAGGALASVTAAYLGSYLGAAGTFWGAGLTSVVITVGGALYQRSLEKTKDRANAAAAKAALKRAAGKPFDGGVAPRAVDPAQDSTRLIRPRSGSPLSGMHWPGGEQVVDEPVDARRSAAPVAQRPEPGRTRAARNVSSDRRSGSEQEGRTRMLRWDGTRYVPPVASGARAKPTGPERSSPASNSPGSSGSGPRRVRWAALAATGALMFGLCMLVVTGFEGITGKPMSGGGTGTTLGGVFRSGPQGPETGAEVPAAPETSSRPSQQPERSRQPEPSHQPERSRQPGSVERSTSPEPSGPRAPTTSARPTGEPVPGPSSTGARPTGTAPAGGVGPRQPTPEAEPEVADQNSSPETNSQ